MGLAPRVCFLVYAMKTSALGQARKPVGVKAWFPAVMGAATVLLNFMLLGGAAGIKPWLVFESELQDKARHRLAASSALADGNSLATSIYDDVLDFWAARTHIMEEPDRLQNRYKFKFDVFVWNADVPIDYTQGVLLGPRVTLPSLDRRYKGLFLRVRRKSIVKGMAPLLYCLVHEGHIWHSSKPLGRHGWPCPRGGSVAVNAWARDGSSKNCMIFYSNWEVHPNVAHMTAERAEQRRNLLRQSMTFCEAQQPRISDERSFGRIDLTNLAACIQAAYPDALLPKNDPGSQLVLLRGIAVMAVYAPHLDGKEVGYGLRAPGGGVVIAVKPIPSLDLNQPPLHLRYIFAFSNSHA